MLSMELYEQAQKRFQSNPLRLELLEYIWKYAQGFDFSDKKVLQMPMPTHEVSIGEKENGIRIAIHTETIPFGHDLIRTVASALTLYPVSIQNKELLQLKLMSPEMQKSLKRKSTKKSDRKRKKTKR